MKIYKSDFFRHSKFKFDFYQKIENIKEWEILAKQFNSNIFLLNNEKEKKIPKIIHQIWIGPKKLPKRYKKWMDSWLFYNPSFEYKLWLEKDIDNISFKNREIYDKTQCIGSKSDIARYEILNLYGGIYVDTDFECLKEIPNVLLEYDFVSSTIFSYKPCIANGFFMTKKNSNIILDILGDLKIDYSKVNINKSIENTGPGIMTKKYFELDTNSRKDCLILPTNYFYPYPNFLINTSSKYINEIKNISIGIHHWEMSWMKGNLLNRILNKIKKHLKMMNNIFSRKICK